MFVSTGISISSINRIKELAEEKKFKEALEILDTQDLDKSINPQFLRICGEIFRENKRYYNSRKYLLKAHQMAPQGTRIIRELIELYLELGYFSKAQKYYEQYLFYSTPEDTQKEYVEYVMKKATGADVKELAAILIPVLERMPGDQWNFEAILLYHKMDRKDMALEESRYILENFKESVYVQPVIDYIDDLLDVDSWFYVYPKEEVPEDVEVYGDLIALEEKLLEADHLMMYPPEARIMVEADDNDAVDVKPTKEKKARKKFGKNAKKQEVLSEQTDKQELDSDNNEAKEPIEQSEAAKAVTKDSEISQVDMQETESVANSDSGVSDGESSDAVDAEESIIKQEREAALEKILSRKIDKDKLVESAHQAAKAVKEIDVSSAQKQVKNVVHAVKDNVKKASDVFGEAVGVKQAEEPKQDTLEEVTVSDGEQILDGIIESVLEPPKKMVGEIVMNEELDALIPDSLEAMSEQEAADIEARKEELERLELEALEASLKLEEEKKAKKNARLKRNAVSDDTEGEVSSEEETLSETDDSDDLANESLNVESEQNATVDEGTISESDKTDDSKEISDTEADGESQNIVENNTDTDVEDIVQSDGSTYAELKSRFMEEEEIPPLDSLGFITVVHSDIDDAMEDAVPDAAGILRQMIDNKEFYSGENSLGFESKASYENHGFEVEDYDFDEYRKQQENVVEQEEIADTQETLSVEEDIVSVQEIYTQDGVVAFEDVFFEDAVVEETTFHNEEVDVPEMTMEDVALNDEVQESIEETVQNDAVEAIAEESVWSVAEEESAEETVQNDAVEVIAEESVWSAAEEEPVEETVQNDAVEVIAEESVWSAAEEESVEETVQNDEVEVIAEESVWSVAEEEPAEETVQSNVVEVIAEESVWSAAEEGPAEETVQNDAVEVIAEESVWSDTVGVIAEENVWSNAIEEAVEEAVEEAAWSDAVEETIEEAAWSDVAEETVEETAWSDVVEEAVEEAVWNSAEGEASFDSVSTDIHKDDYKAYLEETMEVKRQNLRADIVLSNQMQNLLLELKESR